MNTRNIPQFDPKRQLATLRPEIDRQIAAVLDSGRYIGGPAVREFEKVFGDYLGVTHGLGCGSGTASLKLALRGMDIGQGDEIITTPLTFIATVGMILGGCVRVGMEDNIYYKKGELAKSNAQLVERIVRIARDLGKEPATPDEARQILGLKPVK